MSGDGTQAALDMAVRERDDDAADEAEQLQLLLDELGMPAPAPTSQAAAIVEARRKAGRPKGSRNRRTMAMAEYVRSQVTSPALTLSRMAAMPVDALAALLGCSKLEAWQEKRLCAQAAAPYVDQRMPIAVDLTQQTTVTLNIFEGAVPELPGEAVEIFDFQEVSDGGKSDV